MFFFQWNFCSSAPFLSLNQLVAVLILKGVFFRVRNSLPDIYMGYAFLFILFPQVKQCIQSYTVWRRPEEVTWFKLSKVGHHWI